MIKNNKGENVGNTIKLVSGFILLLIGVLIAYETLLYNLISVLLIVSIIISIVGVMMMVSYFIDSNATRTTNMIKEFMESKEGSIPSFRGFERNDDGGSLRAPKNLNSSANIKFDEYIKDDYYYDSFEDESKAVLNVAP